MKLQIKRIVNAWVMNRMLENEGVAMRELLYCQRKKEEGLKKLIIRIRGPYLLKQERVNFKFDEGAAGCLIEFDGLDEDSIEVIGIDKLHALSLAVDIDPYLKGMLAKYEFYWMTGDNYFE